jgi:hypothetical protein
MGLTREDVAKKILNAKPVGGARYAYIDNKDAVLGDFELEIETFKKIVGQVDKQEKFIAEFLVHGSPNAEKQPPGSRLQWIRTPATAKFPDNEWSELQNLMLAALPTMTESDIEEAYGPANPLAGLRVHAKVFKKQSGFVCVRFSPVESDKPSA